MSSRKGDPRGIALTALAGAAIVLLLTASARESSSAAEKPRICSEQAAAYAIASARLEEALADVDTALVRELAREEAEAFALYRACLHAPSASPSDAALLRTPGRRGTPSFVPPRGTPVLTPPGPPAGRPPVTLPPTPRRGRPVFTPPGPPPHPRPTRTPTP